MAKTSLLAFSLLLIGTAPPASAKAPTAMVALRGPGIDAPAPELPRYTVQFHVQFDDEVRMLYVMYYVWDDAAGRALLQVPDVSDKWHKLDVSTISRCCHGKWFYATQPWGEAIRAALPTKP